MMKLTYPFTIIANVLGIMNMTRHEVGLLRTQGSGGVIANFGSLASWGGGAAYSAYSATKWAVSGFTESLHDEVKEFGISGVVIEPGYFRTGFLNTPGKGEGASHRLTVSDPMTEAYRGTAVEQTRNGLEQVNDKQPGDVVKGAKVIVDVLTRSGVAEGREIPMRLVLGKDAVQGIRDKLKQTEALLNEWEEIAASTDHDDVKTA
jgi:NAD(P)-dependent dehydrogenase (short-subunit alcohol dehydrogenase family)